MDADPLRDRLVVRGVSKAFGPTAALAGAELSARAGEVHAVLGENGAGKSTLMNLIGGAFAPDSGEILLDGERFRPENPLEARRAGVARVHQELSLCPHLTVHDNILLGREPARFGVLDRRAGSRFVGRALAAVTGEARRLDPRAPIADLSPADRQLVEIARAIGTVEGEGDERGRDVRCRVLILDEPTSSLASADVERLFELLGALRRRGLLILYISHFLEEVSRVCDRFTVLRDGKTVGTGAIASTPMQAICDLMVGRTLDELFPRSERTPGDEILGAESVAGRNKPESASFSLRRGEVLGLAGLVGAGRTELLRALFGLDPIRRGRVKLGAFVGHAPPSARIRQGMGMLSEDRKGEGLALALSIAENLTMSPAKPLGPWGLVSPARERAAALRWTREFGVRAADPEQRVGELSGGNQQKVALARLLHDDADVLLLDEPTRGIDVGSKAQIYGTIDALAAKGKAILFVSSYLPELLGVCDRIAVMHKGRLGAPRPVGEWNERELLREMAGV